MRGYEEHACFLAEKVFEQSIRLLEKDASLAGYRERVVVLKQELTSLRADFIRRTTHHTANKGLFGGVCTAFTLHKTALQQCASTYFKKRRKLLAGKAFVEAQFRKFRAETHTIIDRIETSSDGKTKRENDIDSERVTLLVFGNCLKRQLQLRSEDSQEVETVLYRLDDAAVKHGAHKTPLVFLGAVTVRLV